MENDYPFSWLDALLEIRLNPLREEFSALDAGELQQVLDRFSRELDLLLVKLKSQAFWLLAPDKIKPVVGIYLEAIAALQNQAKENLAGYPEGSIAAEACERLLIGLDGLQRRIEKRYTPYLPAAAAESGGDSPLYKVLVRLSVDQVAIILKAADEARLLVSRSLSLVFRNIMPFLSTEKTKDISWKSARSSTYKMEEVDKQAAIAALEQLITRIRRF